HEKRLRRGEDQRRKPDRRRDDVHAAAGADAERGDEACAQSLRRAPPDDVERVGPGRHVEEQPRDDEKTEVVDAGDHALALAASQSSASAESVFTPCLRQLSSTKKRGLWLGAAFDGSWRAGVQPMK